MSAIGGVEAVSGVLPSLPSLPTSAVSPTGAAGLVDGPAAGGSADPTSGFAAAMGRGIEQMQAMEAKADHLAVQAATGDLTDVHDYVIAANQAKLMTQLTTTVRNKAVEAFSEIMRMQA